MTHLIRAGTQVGSSRIIGTQASNSTKPRVLSMCRKYAQPPDSRIDAFVIQFRGELGVLMASVAGPSHCSRAGTIRPPMASRCPFVRAAGARRLKAGRIIYRPSICSSRTRLRISGAFRARLQTSHLGAHNPASQRINLHRLFFRRFASLRSASMSFRRG